MDNEIEDDGKKDPLLTRLDFLFDVLDIDDLDCQQKVICEVVSNQEKFSPLSDLLISLFRYDLNRSFSVMVAIQHLACLFVRLNVTNKTLMVLLLFLQ